MRYPAFCLFWVLLLGLGHGGCYQATRMNLQPLYQPWIENPLKGFGTKSQNKSPYVEVLQPKDVVFHLLHSNPRLLWMRQQLKVDQAAVHAFSQVENPEVRVMGLSAALGEGNLNNFGVRLRWTPPLPTVYEAKKDYALAMAQVSEQKLWQETYQLLSQAQLLYLRWVATALRIEQKKQQVAQKKEFWLWEKKRKQADISSSVQETSRHLGYLQALSSLRLLEGQHAQMKALLVEMLGIQGPCQSPPPETFFRTQTRAFSQRDLLLQALQRSPDLAMTKFRFRAHHAQLWLEKSKRIPWFSFLQVSYEFGSAPWMNGFVAGAGLQIPIFDFNTGKIRHQEVQIQALQQQAQIQIARIVSKLRGTYQRWELAQKQAARHQRTIEQQIRKSLKSIARVRTQIGVRPEQIWKVREQVLLLKQQQIEQMMQLHLARLALEQAAYAPVWKRYAIKSSSLR
ncbi:MAG: TolC family protein [Myxococcales bacterium]|nr:TolC family protein [Myxococcales bacterium]